MLPRIVMRILEAKGGRHDYGAKVLSYSKAPEPIVMIAVLDTRTAREKMLMAVILVLVLLTGCTATLQNTPQQDRTLAAYHACRAEGRVTNVSIDRVEPDGRWVATTSSPDRSAYGLQELEACMREHLSQTR
jgi:hypothetical protein